MSFPLTLVQMECLPIIRGLVADKPWLPASYVMAHVRIESGWDPSITSSDGLGSIGLMQVLPATVQDMIRDGFIDPSMADQSVAANSLATGIAYLDWGRAYLMHAWHFTSTILYHPVCLGFNEGYGAVVQGRVDSRYFLKWASAQQGYAFVDVEQFA